MTSQESAKYEVFQQYQGIDPWMNLQLSRDKSSVQQAISAPTAREGLHILSSIQSGEIKGITASQLRPLIEAGFVEVLNAQKAKELSALQAAGSKAEGLLVSTEEKGAELVAQVEKRQKQVGSLRYEILSFLCGSDSKRRADRAELDSLFRKMNETRAVVAKLKSEIKSGYEAETTLAQFVKVDGELCALTDSGRFLIPQLAARRSVLAGVTLSRFDKALQEIHGEIGLRIERGAELVKLFKAAGFNTREDSAVQSILAISSYPGEVGDVLKRASDLDTQLAQYKLKQSERLHLIPVLLARRGSATEIASELNEQRADLKPLTSKYSEFRKVYLAAHLTASALSRSERTERFEHIRKELKALDIPAKSELADHLAARLVSASDRGIEMFTAHFQELRAAGYDRTESALAALSLSRTTLPADRAVRLVGASAQALIDAGAIDSTKGQLGLLSAIACHPHSAEPLIQLILDAQTMIADSELCGGDELRKSMIICLGSLAELQNQHSELAEDVMVSGTSSLRQTRTSDANHGNSAQYYGDGGGDTYLYPFIFDSSDSGTHHPYDAIHDAGKHGHDAALCGSSNSHHSDSGAGSYSSGHSTDHSSSHSACSSHTSSGSSGHSSCSSHSCSSSASSCGSSSCGGSCGGGGD